MGQKPKVDVPKALVLRLKNHLTYNQIGKQFNCDKAAVHRALAPFVEALKDIEAVKAFEENETSLISAAKMKIFTFMVNNETLKKASLNNLAYSYKELDNVKRLEEGKATARIDYVDYTKSLADLEKEIAEERAKIIDVTPKSQLNDEML